jgi:hypothetical protein
MDDNYPAGGVMTDPQAQAGWHRDPQYPSALMRWWDGSRWTEHTQRAPTLPQLSGPSFAQPRAASGYGRVGVAPTVWQRNRTTGTVLAVVAAYLVLAATTGIVLLGIMPVMMSITALRRKEPLGIVAVVAAGVAVVIGFTALAH